MNVINILELVGIVNAGVCYTEIKAKESWLIKTLLFYF